MQGQEIVAVLVVLVLVLAGYWSLVIFPRQQAFKKHNQYVRTMHVGDEVITFGGIIGQITKLDADAGIAYVRIADGVEVKLLTAALTRPYTSDDVSLNARIGVEPGVEAQLQRRG